IGTGGREHILAHKLKQSSLVNEIFAIPGNDAMSDIADVHCEIAETDHTQIVEFAVEHDISWVIIGPEQPLTEGLADKLNAKQIKVLGLDQAAAHVERSKLLAKQLRQKYHIPTAEYKEISNRSDALNYIEACQYPIVLKKDGLAAGKGVIIAENY